MIIKIIVLLKKNHLRLTHLKISGFKSFVDSITIELHGQRVGIVGPNGCGKSNVMESMLGSRWIVC